MRRISHAGGVAAYLALVVLIMRFDPAKLLAPLPFLCILAGTVLLTGIQFKRGQSWPERLDLARWNAFLSGLLTSLVELLALFSSPDSFQGADALALLVEALIPLLYGSILSLALDVRPKAEIEKEANREPESAVPQTVATDAGQAADDTADPGSDCSAEPMNPASTTDTTGTIGTIRTTGAADAMYGGEIEVTGIIRVDTETAHRILTGQGFTERECHVALKLIGDVPNREIAESLYITETTVKKHIQNLFRKCGATDRRVFRQQFLAWMRDDARRSSSGVE